MKTAATLSLILALSTTSLAFAQSADMKGGHMDNHTHAASASATTHSTSGIVKKVDVAKGTVTFAHEPIPVLGWPAMTMNFSVKDKALFKKLNVGKKVAFEFQQQGADNVVTVVK